MNANVLFEIKAEAFRIMTGMMAPGKDVGMAGSEHTYEERCRIWGDWIGNNYEVINAMLKAVDTICPEADE
jgi:hypothetical protein